MCLINIHRFSLFTQIELVKWTQKIGFCTNIWEHKIILLMDVSGFLIFHNPVRTFADSMSIFNYCFRRLNGRYDGDRLKKKNYSLLYFTIAVINLCHSYSRLFVCIPLHIGPLIFNSFLLTVLSLLMFIYWCYPYELSTPPCQIISLAW